jgi:hypothetical protein
MKKDILENQNVKLLIETFDLEVPSKFNFLVTDYETSVFLEKPMIIIKEIEVYDADGVFVKNADLNLILPNLSKYNVKFK